MTSLAEYLNALDQEDARSALERCCGSSRWIESMLGQRPYTNDDALFTTARQVWEGLDGADWLEAFSHHPRIGERLAQRGNSSTAREWSRREQAGAAAAGDDVQEALAAGNRAYEARFGHVFLICATGKGGEEMLAELERRLGNTPQEELREAAAEQAKIIRLRLEKLLQP